MKWRIDERWEKGKKISGAKASTIHIQQEDWWTDNSKEIAANTPMPPCFSLSWLNVVLRGMEYLLG